MRFLSFFVAVFCAAMLIQVDMGYARGGGGRSFGSRGSRSYQSSPSGAQPLQRSTAPQYNPSPAYAPPPASGNPIARHPFLSGVAGGVVGAGLGHMMFGGGGGGYGGGFGGSGGGGFGLLPILLIGLLAYFGFRYFRRRSGAAFDTAGSGSILPFNSATGAYNAPSPSASQNIVVSAADVAAFKQLFLDVQKAWSEQNINRMRQCMTPEMVGYFNDELSANISRGVSNQIDHIDIRDVETVEAWQEDNLSYASVRIQWDACDYDVRLDRQPTDADYLASGSRERPDTVQEQWTFSRAENGRWLLSAIQQL